MINESKKIHFVGIKGVGMTPLAIIAKQAGFEVSGSDIADQFITDVSLQKVDIRPYVGFDPTHIQDCDLVITTGAHGGYDNIEVKTAKEKGIHVLSQGEALGMFMRGELFQREQIGISVFGSHGKTTTTAMVATIFKEAALDPTYVIGTSTVPSLGESGHFGSGTYFIAEADEYATEPVHDKTPKLLWQYPKFAVCTNIELDHPDMYDCVDDVINVFEKFVTRIPSDGMLICCGDDTNVKKLVHSYTGPVKTYGLDASNDVVISDITVVDGLTQFTLSEKGETLGQFTTQVLGVHNALNATAAILTARVVGVSSTVIQKGIAAFSGSKRRLEYRGKLATGALCFDDYGHHPTEIKASLQALSQSYKDKKIVCIFQPHTYSRTKTLFTEFSHAFSQASVLVLMDIYASAREPDDPTVSVEDLAYKIAQNGVKTQYLPKPIDVIKYVRQNSFGDDVVIVTMGAGDVYKIWEELGL